MRHRELESQLRRQAEIMLERGIPRKLIARRLGINPDLLYRLFPKPNPLLAKLPTDPSEANDDEDDTEDDLLTPEQQAKLSAIRESIQPPGYRTCREIREMMRK